jgi:hypothetical protein
LQKSEKNFAILHAYLLLAQEIIMQAINTISFTAISFTGNAGIITTTIITG